MLSIYHILVMMSIFYVNRQQYWKCIWTIIITANAHGKQAVSAKLPQLCFQWHWAGNELVFKSPPHTQFYVGWLESRVAVDCFTVWPFHSVTILAPTCWLKLRMTLLRWRIFGSGGGEVGGLPLFGGGGGGGWKHYYYFVPFTDLGSRGYFSV